MNEVQFVRGARGLLSHTLLWKVSYENEKKKIKNRLSALFQALAHQTPQNADWIQRDIEFTNINSDSVPWTAFSNNLFPLCTTERYIQQIDPYPHFIEPSLSAASEEEEFLTKISNLVEKYGIKHYFRYVCSIPTPHPQHQFTVIDRFGFGFISSANDLVTAELMIRDLYRHWKNSNALKLVSNIRETMDIGQNLVNLLMSISFRDISALCPHVALLFHSFLTSWASNNY